MKTQIISDTHGKHREINIEKDLDMIIHCGDSTNYYEWMPNQKEFENFIVWFSALPIKHKVLIAGNHDAWATKPYNIDRVKELGINYLEHEYLEIEGKILFGSPYTPTFNNWHFMKDRSKLDKWWQVLVPNIDVLITHGPPHGILDLSRNRDNVLEYCGDKALLRHVLQNKPKYHCFGHIHNYKDCVNQGTRIYEGITFINASVVEDGKFNYPPSSHGVIINL